MPTFAYRAADRQGQTIDGVMEAPDARGVVERLQRDAYFPIHVKAQDEGRSAFGLTMPSLGRGRITRVEVLTLFQQLATLIEAGLPLDRALVIRIDLLGRDLIWVSGLIAALLSLSMILGNALVRPLSRIVRTRTGLLIGSMVIQAAMVVLCGVLGLGVTAGEHQVVPHRFIAVVGLYLVYGVALGVMGPVKQGYLNAHIPSANRATIISLDSFFANLGGVAGQSGWGYLARARSIAEAWVGAGAALFIGVPLYWWARRSDRDLDSFETSRRQDGGSAA